jgi:hypothetical protein
MDKKITLDDLEFITERALKALIADLLDQLQIKDNKSATASIDRRLLNLQTPQKRSLLLARIRGVIESKLPSIKIQSATGGRQQDKYTVTIRLQ